MLVVATARVNSVGVTYLIEFLARRVQLCLNVRHLLFLVCECRVSSQGVDEGEMLGSAGTPAANPCCRRARAGDPPKYFLRRDGLHLLKLTSGSRLNWKTMGGAGITGRTRPTKVKKQASAAKRKRDDVDVEKLEAAVTALVRHDLEVATTRTRWLTRHRSPSLPPTKISPISPSPSPPRQA